VSFTAVVMAAGQGTRMKSQTPKVLHDLCGLPMVQWPIRAAREAGADRVIVVTGPEGVAPEGCEHAIQAVANGTGGAVVAAAELIAPDATVVVINGDAALITSDALRALVAGHEAQATVATVTLDDPSGYGRVIRDGDGRVTKIVETKSPGDATEEELAVKEINGGVYVFDGGALLEALQQLDTDNAQGELYLTDVVAKVGSADAVDLGDPELLAGINDRAELAQVAAILQRRILDAHMRAGVTVVNPAATTVDAGVELARDVTLEPGTVLRGATAVGEGTVIGPSSTIIDTAIGRACRLLHTYALGARLDDGVSVGPFAYLRPGTHLRDGAKIGTFVEIKNSDIGEGTKVPHLSYIGDADVGPQTNLGASTVTANYDGQSKHRTTIGARVKSAVDVTFVAPVKVGDDGWTAAGSVITNDVPDGALGVARARQKNIPGYAARRAAQTESES
jgi:bifunctional UDP-N-acetylglucosamine pyrophosphorylase/glucosamine-1-phosphate N-acetyltransferase